MILTPVVAVTYPPQATPEWLAEHAGVVRVVPSGPDGLPAMARDLPVAGLIVRSECRVDAALLERLPDLKFVVRAGSGLDGIDQAELTRRGIELVRNPKAGPEAVAELAMAGLVALTRRIPVAIAMVRRGQYGKHQLVGDCLGELSIAVWGAGPVGLAVAGRARHLGAAEVRVVRPRRENPVDPDVYRMDVHILCLPLAVNTRHWFGAEFFERVRDSRPYVCNMGRYELIDMTAAMATLDADSIRGLYVDPIDSPHLPEVGAMSSAAEGKNVLFTLHQGAQRKDVRRRLDAWAFEQALSRLQPA